MEIKLPGIPDIAGDAVSKDAQLREILIALKITIEKITGATVAELGALLDKND